MVRKRTAYVIRRVWAPCAPPQAKKSKIAAGAATAVIMTAVLLVIALAFLLA